MEYKTVRYEIQALGPLGFTLVASAQLPLEQFTELYVKFTSSWPDTKFRMLRIETITTVIKSSLEARGEFHHGH